MPQLDVVYALLTFIWAWSTLVVMMIKIRTIMLNKELEKKPMTNDQPGLIWNLPWT
uniref:ATPase subunit 8 n=1 Tax=Cylindrophis ruffus TaxID=186578 RepID=Q402L2_CYLRU|nr:ATP synthase F0 subunit 8 [Cylindrophis ruffus]BAE20031.1 ATPase subunit 8 [Cylindrophis ruffus]